MHYSYAHCTTCAVVCIFVCGCVCGGGFSFLFLSVSLLSVAGSALCFAPLICRLAFGTTKNTSNSFSFSCKFESFLIANIADGWLDETCLKIDLTKWFWTIFYVHKVAHSCRCCCLFFFFIFLSLFCILCLCVLCCHIFKYKGLQNNFCGNATKVNNYDFKRNTDKKREGRRRRRRRR